MDIDDWQPPTEAEMKIIKARQERSNKISLLMSNYLLKGYKMLGSVCSVCETILLQDKQGVMYCVTCSELNSDGDKDNPVINPTAASSLARELSSVGTKQMEALVPTVQSSTHSLNGEDATVTSAQRFCETYTPSGPGDISCPQTYVVPNINIDNLEQVNNIKSVKSSRHNVEQVNLSAHHVTSSLRSTDILTEKVNWACLALQETKDLDHTIRLCQVIKVAAEAIEALKKANI